MITVDNFPLVAPLFMENRDWHNALVFMKGRNPTGIDKGATVYYHGSEDPKECLIVFEDPESADPLYDERKDGPQPKICTMRVCARISDIMYIDYVKYPSIIQGTGNKLVSL